ncbi:MAG: response regulator transcription factor, partial [Deltaproteobacteria bacterium]
GHLLERIPPMKKVYVLDDSAVVRERLIDMLSELEEVGIIGVTGNPQEAMASIRKLAPDAVILDIRLPGGSGIDILRSIKREKLAPLVIMLTSYSYPQYRKECEDVGADYFLNKSTDFDKIGEILKQLVPGSRPP